jgi:hypothetical protein
MIIGLILLIPRGHSLWPRPYELAIRQDFPCARSRTLWHRDKAPELFQAALLISFAIVFARVIDAGSDFIFPKLVISHFSKASSRHTGTKWWFRNNNLRTQRLAAKTRFSLRSM